MPVAYSSFLEKTQEHLSIIYCSLSFYLFCIDLLMMYDRSICANCNFRWEHFPFSKFLAEITWKVSVVGGQAIAWRLVGRGGVVGWLRRECFGQLSGLIATVVHVRGEKTEIILTSGFARKCLCMYLEWHKRIWLSQQLKYLPSFFFPFYLGTEDVTS